jgi:hypothetical protein
MSAGSRVEVPQEFYDRVSDQLLLAPDHQYVYADLILSTLGVNLALPDMVGLPGRDVMGQGAPYATAEAGRLILETDPITQDLIAVDHNFKGETGDSVRFNRPLYTDWSVAEADRRLRPGQTISTTGIDVGSEQAVMTLHRYAGPYSSATAGAGAIGPVVIEKFDLERGVHNLVQLKGMHLRRDFHRFVNARGVDVGDSASTTVRPVGMTDDNTATAKGEFTLDHETCIRTAQSMDDAKLPTLGDGKRLLVVTPQGLAQLNQDPSFVNAAKEESRLNPLMHRYTSMRAVLPEWYVFVSTTLTTTANNSSINIHTAHAWAPGAMGVGMGSAPRVAASSNDNYGESIPIVWIAYMAFACLDSRFVYKVNYTESAT